jgi:hypothetical protein
LKVRMSCIRLLAHSCISTVHAFKVDASASCTGRRDVEIEKNTILVWCE